MEEPINVRYTFTFLLAIADPLGYVIGTDVAIARRLNMLVPEFKECVAVLMQPDANSNSKEQDGRRVVESDSERGYFLVNYAVYREMKDEDGRRSYMREYMRKRRAQQSKLAPVNGRKHPLAQEDASASASASASSDEGMQGKKGYAVPACFAKIEGFTSTLAAWIEHRQKLRKPATGHAIQLVIDRCAEKPARAIEALNTCIERGWQSFKWEWLDGASRNGPRAASRGIELTDDEMPETSVYT